MDRLSTLLAQFGMHASTFHSGAFYGSSDYAAPQRGGSLHLLGNGRLGLQALSRDWQLTEPSLIFMPRPLPHTLQAHQADKVQLVSAYLGFDGGLDNPLTTALPDCLVIPVRELPTLQTGLGWVFAESAEQNCGRYAVLNRLVELVMIQLLRHVMNNSVVSTGMMAGLADWRLARAVTLMHDQPEKSWSVAELASAASMSRASFAAQFHKVVGKTPADYLLSWRVSLTQKRLREGKPIALIADEVGYDSPSALARAFRRKTGASPREWLQQQ